MSLPGHAHFSLWGALPYRKSLQPDTPTHHPCPSQPYAFLPTPPPHPAMTGYPNPSSSHPATVAHTNNSNPSPIFLASFFGFLSGQRLSGPLTPLPLPDQARPECLTVRRQEQRCISVKEVIPQASRKDIL
ncbi:unnamed protein product [Pleuronectes platessa]|uniref:Uncharacterized protein n=1 Tax=Pleuronectes platessa TaxID=8262 RepID=A0A9N7VZT0_PLEPL|nr:unnamed protein product [Pleuronectes platessa]